MKNIVITGSTKGIGLGLAKEFLKSECNVVISWLTEEKIQERFNSEEYSSRDLFSPYGL